ncbi:P-loop containing nucleoside triphosphate hydrolase protein [Xylaria digitata]|nr:P-loop containing nucleoside triphosphate hydrolase protein [Xylaria digitata]
MVVKKPTRQFHVRRRPNFRARFPRRNLPAVAEDDSASLEEELQNFDEAIESDGEDCEIHYYEERIDTHGEEVCLRVGTKSVIEIEKHKSHRACLVRFRNYDEDRELLSTRLQIQSKHLHKALREVIGPYLGHDFNIPIITIYHPLKPLFHYRKELQEYAEKCNQPKMRSHLDLCLRYVKYTLSREIALFDRTFANASSNLEIDHKNLWIVYKPGDLIYIKDGRTDTVSRLRKFEKQYEREDLHKWKVTSEQIQYDGTDFGHVDICTYIDTYRGQVSIRDLNAFPLHFHSKGAQIRDDLIQRGQLYVSLRGVCHRFFDGVAKFRFFENVPRFPVDKNETELHVRHRVILDTVAFHNNSNAKTSINFNMGSAVFRTASKGYLQMREEDFMICSHEVHGYDLVLKLWGRFSVAGIQDVKFNHDAFSHLLLSSDKKKLISSLVIQHGSEVDEFDDYIQGKGKGLIFLLHGPPGVGKTFTAESIADHAQRPLFTVSSDRTMYNLSKLLKLASSWGAVVLIDEADIFMQERDLSNLARNDPVSTLLRTLEYFEGIMFLTTNRPEVFDSAFQSRIHLSIAYPPLSRNSRGELWRAWITRANSNSEPDWLTESCLNELANRDLNGREIKNAMKIAHALACSEKRHIHDTDVFRGLETHEEFKTSFQKDLVQRKAGESEGVNRQQGGRGLFFALHTAYAYFCDAARFLAFGEI